MSSIKEKSDYFLVSKNNLKTALQIAGADIDDNTPFRQYADKVTAFASGVAINEDYNVMKVLDLMENKIYSNAQYVEAYAEFQKYAKLHLGEI